jgi:hypothetical protein
MHMNSLRLFKHLDRVFESHLSYRYLCAFILFVLHCVQAEALRRADPPSRESYRLCKKIKKLKSRQGPTKGYIIILNGLRPSPVGTAATSGLLYKSPDDRWGWLWSNWWNEGWQGKPKYSEKTCPSATLSTTNPTWPDPGSNPGRRSGKPETNCLSYDTANKGL